MQPARGCPQHGVSHARGTPEALASHGGKEAILAEGGWPLGHRGKETLPTWLLRVSDCAKRILHFSVIKSGFKILGPMSPGCLFSPWLFMQLFVCKCVKPLLKGMKSQGFQWDWMVGQCCHLGVRGLGRRLLDRRF